jgi:enoyl-[acyl-carrier protein] reductase I
MEATAALTPVASLAGRKGVILGIASRESIAFGCARAFRALGAELVVTYLNAKVRSRIESLARELDAPIVMPCDVQQPEQLEALFDAARTRWGRIDFALHSIAFAPRADLHGRVVDSSRDGFLSAMDISCHSFARMARLASPLMSDGGTLLTVSFAGSRRVVPNYSVMGPVKAALECLVKYLASELGPNGIRVHALSPSPLKTRAASGLRNLDAMLEQASARAPMGSLPGIADVGAAASFLVSDAARRLNGLILPIDAGLHVMA